MNERAIRRLSLGIWMLSLSLISISLLLPHLLSGAVGGVRRYDFWREVLLGAPIHATVGMLIMTQRPHHRIGWFFAGIGAIGALQFFCGQYATSSLILESGTMPGAAIAAWVSDQAQILLVGSLVLIVLIFPTGHLPSRRWSVIVWVTALAIGGGLIGTGLAPGGLNNFPSVENPFGTERMFAVVATFSAALESLFLVAVVSAIASLLVRLRSTQGVERQQVKWFMYVVSLSVVMLFAPDILLPEQRGSIAGNLLWAAVAASPAVGAAIAILRYRLYDIDLIINRTLVYGTLTAFLAMFYFGSVVLLQRLLAPLIGSNDQIAIVASTLAIAALFQPLRRRIQAIIDRRFYRRKYDAQKTLQAFSVKLREETDLEELSNDLIAIVNDALQPAHVSLWMKPIERKVQG